MLFALAMDKVVFGHSPELLSIIGSSLILGSAICIAMKQEGQKASVIIEPQLAAHPQEELGLVDGIDAEDEDEAPFNETEFIPMRQVAPHPHSG
jgi:hypothetical protein